MYKTTKYCRLEPFLGLEKGHLHSADNNEKIGRQTENLNFEYEVLFW